MPSSSTDILRELVAIDTRNPGGDEPAACRLLARHLEERGADSVEVVEIPRDGETGAYVFARFGTPRLLVNVHIDTVPDQKGWTRDPLSATVDGDRIYGLGTADTKGAAAAVLTALADVRPKDVGILFSGDEERATTVMTEFVASGRTDGVERAIVCEPTGRAVGIRHRGIYAFRATIRGPGGHSSTADTELKPIVAMARLATALDELAAEYLERGPEEMRGICMNVAGLDGGVAFNVIPDRAHLTWSLRPPPGFDADEYLAAQAARIRTAEEQAGANIELETVMVRDGFACRDFDSFAPLLGDRAAPTALQFWTEAALLSQAGVDAVVIGPGDIAQAHAADEFVTLADLDWSEQLFRHAFEQTRAPQ